MKCLSAVKRKLRRRTKHDRPGTSAITSPKASCHNTRDQKNSGIDTHQNTVVTDSVSFTPISSPPIPIETSPQTPNHDSPTTKAPGSDIWADAYETFAKREPDLDNDYKKYLAMVSKVDLSNPDWVKSTVEGLQKSRENKQWQVTFHGKDIKFRAQAEKLAKFLLWCNGIVKDALSVQPYAALAWSGVSILLPLLTSATAQHEAMLSHLDTINHVQVYWKAYQDAFPEDFRANGDSLVELYSHIFEYQARTICHLSSAQLSRAWQKVAGWNDWEKKAAHVDGLSQHCKSLIDVIQDEAAQRKCNQQLEQMYRSREVLQQIYEVLDEEKKQQRNNHQDEQERKLLADLAADHEGYKNFNPRKVKNTCQWFLEDASFLSWRDNEESSFLWVSAGPGCGKSVLSRSLIDEWQLSTSAATSVVCYFFFKDGDEKRQHSTNALSAILHQLFMQDLTGKFMSHALPRHKNYGSALATNFYELWNILLDCATTPDAGDIVCVLDALDECNKQGRDEIIGTLKDFYSITSQVSRPKSRLKFFVTSRPYDTIERSIGSFLNSSCLRIDGDDHSAAVSEDVNRVIDAKIPELLCHLSEANRLLISTRLKAMKNRTYLWLRLAFYIIEQHPSDYDKPSDVEELLNDLPSEHSEAYEKILNKTKSKYTLPLFQLMLAAKRPLDIDEANYALAMAPEEPSFKSHSEAKEGLWNTNTFKSTAKNFCGLLVDFHDSKLSFIHQTVREFLTEPPKEGREWNWRGRFKLPECHRVMAFSCIHYLSLPELDIPYDYFGLPNKHMYPFFSYAADLWPFHYREQDITPCNNLLEKALNMCRPHAGQRKLWMKTIYMSGGELTDLAVAAHYGLVTPARTILNGEDGDIDGDNESYDLALYEASQRGFPAVVEMLLLNTTATVNVRAGSHITQTPVCAAVRNNHCGVVEVLFERRNSQIEITDDLIKEVARYGIRAKAVALLFEKAGEKAKVTEAVLVAAARNRRCGRGMLDLLLKQRAKRIQISDDIGVRAARNSDRGKETIDLLFKERGEQAVVLEAAGNWACGKEILELLFEKQGERIQVTEAVIVAAAGNWTCGKEILELLFKQREQIQVTEAIMVAAAGNENNGKEVLEVLFKKQGGQIHVTEAVIAKAKENYITSKAILDLLQKVRKQV
ncbi:hypothetical protein F5Y09DRAFT_315195 [Xylaria sp. FL1042]|nr:hypothetical protein F5Y09DRAFT_315195 [Xylaria sp. FL1042]